MFGLKKKEKPQSNEAGDQPKQPAKPFPIARYRVEDQKGVQVTIFFKDGTTLAGPLLRRAESEADYTMDDFHDEIEKIMTPTYTKTYNGAIRTEDVLKIEGEVVVVGKRPLFTGFEQVNSAELIKLKLDPELCSTIYRDRWFFYPKDVEIFMDAKGAPILKDIEAYLDAEDLDL
jgi:hypothetical protein